MVKGQTTWVGLKAENIRVLTVAMLVVMLAEVGAASIPHTQNLQKKAPNQCKKTHPKVSENELSWNLCCFTGYPQGSNVGSSGPQRSLPVRPPIAGGKRPFPGPRKG